MTDKMTQIITHTIFGFREGDRQCTSGESGAKDKGSWHWREDFSLDQGLAERKKTTSLYTRRKIKLKGCLEWIAARVRFRPSPVLYLHK